MTENKIKSEKAKQYLSNQNIPHYEIYSMGSDSLIGIDIIDAKQAVIIAEQEAEERHTKELQTMQTAINEGNEREVIAANILADKRKECERLDKELQELKDKAVEAHRQCCKHILYLGKDVMSICSANTHNKGCFSDCDYMKSFLTELTK